MALIKEADLILPALQVMATSPGGFTSTTDLILELDALLEPEGVDAELLAGRHDSHFSQKVRNLVSHRDNSTGMESRGLATYDDDRKGWTITPAGVALVEAVYG